jgi:hypothetical protein
MKPPYHCLCRLDANLDDAQGAEDGFETSAARWLNWNRPSVPMGALTANRDRRVLAS